MRIRAFVAMGLAAAALLTVSACRIEQGAALFVGDDRISQQRVDEIIDSIPAEDRKLLAQQIALPGNITLASMSVGSLRGFVVDALATIELGKKVAADRDLKPDHGKGSAVKDYWTQPGRELGRDNAFVKLVAEADAYRTVLFDGAKPVDPSNADVKAIAEQWTAIDGKPRNEADREFIKLCLGPKPTVEQCGSDEAFGPEIIGRIHQVRDYLAEYEVTANPRYGDSFVMIQRDPNSGVPFIVTPIPN